MGRLKYFEIKVADTDGTTYSVDERSKGALWYLSFLMKTEFRRKKMRKDSGKPIFLIDEPASNLHSTAQHNMLQDFKKLVEDTSIIYTTHSQYLISLDNIRNTYIIQRQKSVVSAVLWADFIKQDPSQISHYQPLANVLQLVPNNFTIPWEKALITEGPSDAHIMEMMFRVVSESVPNFAIYPGTNAFNLGTLISLNIGWCTDFRVLLDSDKPGKDAQERYIREFDLTEATVRILPKENTKIEDWFTDNEHKKLYEIAFGQKTGKVTKKEFAHAVAILNGQPDFDKEVRTVLSKATKTAFDELFKMLDFD